MSGKKKKLKLGKALLNLLRLFFSGAWWTVKGIASIIRKIFTKTKRLRETKKRKILDENMDYSKFNVMETLTGNIGSFEKKLESSGSTIGIILGARGTGKSAIGMRILENIYSKKKRRCYAIGFKPEDLPTWITVVDDIKQIGNGSFVLIDEGGILFSARDAMKDANKVLSSLLLIARHRDLSILFISQNSANLEINAIRQADYLILKPSSLLQKDFERKKIKEIYEEASERFAAHKGAVGLTYIYSDEYRGFITNSLPSFWSTKVSKAFSKG